MCGHGSIGTASMLVETGMDIKHPYLDITTVDLVEFYAHTINRRASMKNCVIFGDGQVDRSPCGTGTRNRRAKRHYSPHYGKGRINFILFGHPDRKSISGGDIS